MKRYTIVLALKFLIVVLFLIVSVSAFPQKVRKIKGLEVDSLSMFIDSTYLRLPGYPFPIALKVNAKNKGTLYTRGLGGGNLKWNNFNIMVKGGTFSNGKILISNKLFPGDYVEISATSKDHPSLKMSKLIRLNYIDNMDLFTLGAFQKIPGERFSFGVKMRYDNGCKETITSWSQNYKLLTSLKFDFISSGGEIKNNRFYIEPDFENIQNHTVYMVGYTLRVPYISDSLGIILDYKGDYKYYVQASSGMTGRSGSDGSDGSTGSASCAGGTGQPGCNGEPGDEGDRGYDLEVFCDAWFDSILQTELLYIEVNNPEKQHLKKYLINPAGGTIDIISKGGDGGCGGEGGDGGDGGKGGDGKTYTVEVKDTSGTKYITCQEKGGNGGNGGNGGCGGYGGEGGDGGRIDIYYTAKAHKYISCISAQSYGGSGGSGGSSGNGGSSGSGGTPGGSTGNSGSSGSSGRSGSSGYDGSVTWHLADE